MKARSGETCAQALTTQTVESENNGFYILLPKPAWKGLEPLKRSSRLHLEKKLLIPFRKKKRLLADVRKHSQRDK